MIKVNSQNILRGVVIGLGIILVIVALAIAEIRVAGQNRPIEISPEISRIKDQAPAEKSKILYILNKGEGKEILKFDYVLSKDEKKNVFDILKELSVEKNFDLRFNNNYSFGVFVESIAGIKNGDDGKYWQYYINDTLGDVAADKKEAKAGDRIEWRFEKVPEI